MSGESAGGQPVPTGATIVDRRPITPEVVARILENYEIGRAVGEPVSVGGTANANVSVETDQGRYVIRRRNTKYAVPAYVAFDHRFMEHLARHGAPTPLALPTRFGQRWIVLDGDTFEVYPFRPGRAHDRASLAEIRTAAEALAAIHRAAVSFDPPPGKAWPRYDDPAQVRMEWGALDGLDPYLSAQLELIERVLPDAVYNALPKHVIHGDFHPANVTFTESGSVAGVWDMDWCTVQPRIRDVADGLIFFGGLRDGDVDSADIRKLTRTWLPDADRFAAFLSAYEEACPLSAGERSLLPAFMRARWLHCRTIGRSKVPPEERMAFFLNGLLEPLRALDEFDTWFATKEARL